ncbi:MAG: hypothetical protein LBE56_05230 [Tannerella sp.]|jgi:hypothetical protein|nr:hypothetical protein [Tannerella sp.]
MKAVYSIILISTCLFGFVFCNDDDDNRFGFYDDTNYSTSGRDYIYSGNQLSVYIGDEKMNAVKADVQTRYMDAGNTRTDADTLFIDSNYFMRIVLTGFPTASEKTTINTVLLHYTNFSGRDMIKNKYYKFIGEFTGSPLLPPDNQGLIIHFTAD